MRIHGQKDLKTILVVDDSPCSLYLIGFILRCEGYRIIECADGESAVGLAAARLPDLVLMDVKLPGMSGLAATREILGKISPARIPVIAISSNRTGEDHREAFDAGCIACIDKPLDRKVVIKTVKSIIEGAQDVFPLNSSRPQESSTIAPLVR